jgi:hypothetical protein
MRNIPARLASAIAIVAAAAAVPTLATAQNTQRSPTAPRDSLKATLQFLASFDHGFNADYAHGDPLIYSAPSYTKLSQTVGGVASPDVVIAKGQGRYGDALEFRKKNATALFYRAAVNSGYHPRNWSGTVSFWLSLNPDTDLDGYTDPIQLTDKAYNNASVWVDFTREKPRQFRLGVFGDSAAWNKSGKSSEQDPFFNQRTVVVTGPTFTRGQWTHVAIAFTGLGTDAGGTAKLYVNGKLAGTADGIKEPFTWEPFLATIRLGVNYAGLFDELSIYSRALTDAEVDALYHLEGGAATLMK